MGLSESNIKEAMREVRMALLEADVNYAVVRDFTPRWSEMPGQDVIESITPGQQIVKRSRGTGVALGGGGAGRVDLSGRPAAVMLIGLHGSGKTTTAAKLAALWKQAERGSCSPARTSAGPPRPTSWPFWPPGGAEMIAPQAGENVSRLAERALEAAAAAARTSCFLTPADAFNWTPSWCRNSRRCGRRLKPARHSGGGCGHGAGVRSRGRDVHREVG